MFRGEHEPKTAAGFEPTGLVDVTGLARFLSIGVRSTERLVAQGAPHFDFARHHPKRRPKRLLRFDCQEVLAWLRARRNGGGADA